jgi:hypothetical protein
MFVLNIVFCTFLFFAKFTNIFPDMDNFAFIININYINKFFILA